jgi:VWFA-related protein
MRRALAPGVLVVLAGSAASAAEPTSPPPLVIRISVDLIRVDAVVTDKKGRHVRDLGASDFEILQDGRPQKVASVSYVRAGGGGGAEGATPALASAGENPSDSEASVEDDADAPPRTMLLVVDDLGLSATSAAQVRTALLRFVDTYLDDGDRMALVRTGDPRPPYPTTSDRASLRAEVAALRANPASRSGALSTPKRPETRLPVPGRAGVAATRPDLRLAADHAYDVDRVVDSIEVVKSVLDSLRGRPGRKAIVLLTDGFYVPPDPTGDFRGRGGLVTGLEELWGPDERVQDALRSLAELAIRASVVIHTVDPRGVATSGLSASDPTYLAPAQMRGMVRERNHALNTSQATLHDLAEQTGGLALQDNDMLSGLARVQADQDGYYLIGYEPGAGTFSRGRPAFHEIQVKVKRSGLRARSRAGFFGVTDEEIAAVAPVPSS